MSRLVPSLSVRMRGLFSPSIRHASGPAPSSGDRDRRSKSSSVRLRRALVAVGIVAFGFATADAQSTFPGTNVSSTSSAQTVTVTASASGTVARVNVLTAGASVLDFAQSTGTDTCTGSSITSGGTCSVSVTFAPQAPGTRIGAVVLLNGSNSVLGTALISGTGQGGLGVLIPGTINTFAGDGDWKSILDGNPATAANLFLPSSVALDGLGNLYIADSSNNRIRIVCAGTTATIANTTCPAAGHIYTIAGTAAVAGAGSYGGDTQVTTNSAVLLNVPTGVAIDGAGNLYIADSGNNRIRKITAATGVISTVAGNGTAGFFGDAGSATSAELNQPNGVAVDTQGNIYIADTLNNRIRKVDSSGTITTVAGNGTGAFAGDTGNATSAELNNPYTVAADGNGNLYIADSSNNRVRLVCSGNTVTLGVSCTAAGKIFTAYGDGSAATLNSPSGLALDPAGNLYVADTQNFIVRKINTLGVVSTIAGTFGDAVSSGDTGSANDAGIHGPYGLTLDGNGNLYIAEFLGQRVRKVTVSKSLVTFLQSVRQGSKSTVAIPVTVENDGTAALNVTSINNPAGANVAVDSATTTCTTGSLNSDAHCTIGAVFAPAATPPLSTSQSESGDIYIPYYAVGTLTGANSPLDIQVTGTANPVNSTTTTLASSLNPANFGQNIDFTVTVVTGSGTGPLIGTVTIYDSFPGNSTNPVAIVSGQTLTTLTSTSGVVTISTKNLPAAVQLLAGTHTMWACYVPGTDPNHFGSCSTDNSAPALSQVVYEKAGVSLASSANPSLIGASVTLTATVTAGGGGITPSGTVTFTDTTTGNSLGGVSLSSDSASITTSSLPEGPNVITATYVDNNSQVVSTPVSLTQIVQAPSATAIVSNNPSATFGQPVTFTVTVSSTVGGTPAATGTVNIYDGITKIGAATPSATPGQWTFTTTSLSVGSHTIQANYLGDNYNAPSSGSTSETESITQTATSVAASPVPGIAGKAVVLTATVKVVVGASTVTGNVTFTDGTTVLGTVKVSGGTATLTPILAPGAHAIVATYSGDSNDAGSTSTALPLSVILATTATSISTSGSPSYVLAPVTFTATVTGNGGTPTGTVNFFFDGAGIGSATLNGSAVATFTYTPQSVGNHNVTASYAGDTNDNPSSSAAISQVVQPIPTTTSLGESTAGGPPPAAILVATVIGTNGPIPTGTVTFFNGSTVVGQATIDSSGVATLTPDMPKGTYSITASYSGDAIHAQSTAAPFTYYSTPIDFSVSINPSTVSVVTKQNVTVTLTLTSNSGYADNIGVGCLSLPAAVNCHFASDTVSLTSGSTQTVKLTIDTNNPLGGGSSAKNSDPGKANFALAGLCFPASLIFGFILWRFRKAHKAVLLGAIMLFVASAFFVTGCGAFSQSSATPGTYTIQVGGVGKNSNVSHYQSVTLTITK